MADQFLQQLDEVTSVDRDDLLLISDDPAGTGRAKKVTVATLRARNLYFDVADYATGGSGTSADPWTGWTDGTNFCGAVPTVNTTYFFRSGYYSYDTLPILKYERLALVGEEGTVLQHTGTGDAIRLHPTSGNTTTNGSTDADWVFGGRVESLLIAGNANTDDGIDAVGLRSWLFENVRIINVASAGIRMRACVANQFNNCAVTYRYNGGVTMSPQPDYGVYLDKRGSADWTTCATFVNLVVEGIAVGGYGIYSADSGAYGTSLINGTSEGNAGTGLYLGNSGTLVMENFDLEANSQGDVDMQAGSRLHAINCLAISATNSPNVVLTSTAWLMIEGGRWYGVDASIPSRLFASDADIRGSNADGSFSTATVGGYAFDGTTSWFRNCVNGGHTSGRQLPELQGAGGPYTLVMPSGASDTPSLTYRQFHKTLTQNWTCNAPANGTLCQGHELIFVVVQDVTGGHSIAWNSIYCGPGGSSMPLPSTTAGATDIYTFRFRSALAKFELVDFQRGDTYDSRLPVYTTAARPAAGKVGRMIFDSDLDIPLFDSGTAWLKADGTAP